MAGGGAETSAAALAILIGVMALLVSGRVRFDLVGLIALALVGCLHLVPTRDLFSGFSSYAAVILAEMMVLGEGLRRSGAVDRLSRRLETVGRNGEDALLTALMTLPALPSAFTSDVGLMSLLLPAMVRLSCRLKLSLHRLLMPLAIAIALGGLLTMIGSAGNIIGNAALTAAHDPPIPLFGITPLGGLLVVAGWLFMQHWGLARLPAPPGERETTVRLDRRHATASVGPSEDLLPSTAPEGPATPATGHPLVAAASFAAVLALAAFNVLPLQVAALGGIAVLILTRVLPPDQAYRAIDWRLIALVGGITPLTRALVDTGVTADAARLLVRAFGGLGPYVLLAVFFWLAAILTQVVSNVAAALVLAPLAVSVAASHHWSPDAFIVAMVVALSAAPITPMANKVFLMTIGPGGYRYQDFLRVGLPLTVVSFVLTLVVTPWLFPFLR